VGIIIRIVSSLPKSRLFAQISEGGSRPKSETFVGNRGRSSRTSL
jgi:hypothetical protein